LLNRVSNGCVTSTDLVHCKFYFNFCILTFQRLHRITTSMRQLEGREMSCKQKLRETIIKRNEHFKKMNCIIKELDRDGSNTDLKQHVTMLQLQVHFSMVYFGYKLYFSFKNLVAPGS
jgi:hypothetical protein